MRLNVFIFSILLTFVVGCDSKGNSSKNKLEQNVTITPNVSYTISGSEERSKRALGSRKLGKATRGEVLKDNIGLNNSGTETIVIKKISTNCGCIRLKYDPKPIMAGGNMVISYSYITGGSKLGGQLSEMLIQTNKGNYTLLVELYIK